jgi:hypothetical protein
MKKVGLRYRAEVETDNKIPMELQLQSKYPDVAFCSQEWATMRLEASGARGVVAS